MMPVIGVSVLAAVGTHLVYSSWLDWMGSLLLGGSAVADLTALAKAAGGVGLVILAVWSV